MGFGTILVIAALAHVANDWQDGFVAKAQAVPHV